MLVLSRRENEKIVFPNLGISVEVIRIAGKAVRIGIDAPRHIRILRDEVADSQPAAAELPPRMDRDTRHALRNRLNTAALGLQVLHRRLEAGQTEEVEPLLFKILGELQEFDAQLDAQKEAEHDEHRARNRRALIVEDNANERQLLAEYLKMSGYDVEVAADGLQAIIYLREHDRPDIVLLDMNMPRLDGPKTITSIRCESAWQGLKLFAVSGANQRDLGVENGPRGVDRWISKPVDAKALVSEMNRELDKPPLLV